MRLLLSNRRRRSFCLLLTIPAFTGILLLSGHKPALAANPAVINFQGKVVNSDGTNVSNGTYAFVFRLYDNSSPTIGANCNSNSQCWWEETQSSVTVTNGVFQVELGSVCAFTSACNSTHSGIDWSTNNALYLTMKFNSDTSGSNNGFMTPAVHLTTVPYAFNADRLGGLDASGFIQNTTSPQSSSNFNISGTGIAGTSLQTPLITTGSGNLAIQPATGIVALNKTSTANELRIYENSGSPTTYISISSGNISTNSGNLTIAAAGTTIVGSDTGAINIDPGSGSAVTITAHAASVWQTDAGSLTIQSGSASALNLTGNAASTLSTSSGNLILQAGSGTVSFGSSTNLTATAGLTVQGGSTLTLTSTTTSAVSLDSGTTGAVNIGTGANNKAVTIGSTTSGTTVSLQAGTTANTALLLGTSGAGGITIDTGTTGSINIGNNSNSKTITIGNSSGTTALVLDAGTNGINLGDNANTKTIDIGGVTNSGTDTINIATNATAADAITIGSTNAGSEIVLQAGINNTTSGSAGIQIGSATSDSSQVNLQLDSSSSFTETASTCSTTVNQGALYYNTTTNVVRGCVNGTWEDIVSTAALGLQLFGVVPDSGSNPGDLAGVTGASNGPCKVAWNTSTTVNVSACTAYSGGRKIIVNAASALSVGSSNGTVHICLTGTNGAAQASASGAATANLPTFSAASPILCLADVVIAATVIADIYDTRTFTTTTKAHMTIGTTAPFNGALAIGSATAGVGNISSTTASSGLIRGVVVASSGATSTNTINAIVATAGPAWVKATAATINNYINNGGTAGFAITVATADTDGYANLGVALTGFNSTCSAATNCSGSLFTDIQLR